MEVILTKQDLEAFVNRVGFLPSSGERAPFSLEKLCPNLWHTDQASDPWRWRMEIAQEGNIAYGKFFHSLSGYIAADCLPAFIALRRGGLFTSFLPVRPALCTKAAPVFRRFCRCETIKM